MSSTNIQIAVKVRPLIERELKEKVEPSWLIRENSIVQIDSSQKNLGEPYSFDQIFDESTTNEQVYDGVVKPLVRSFLEGINTTIFAYGQTSSGKTHTMIGDKDVPGIIMYTIQDIFKHIEETPTKNFLLRCSYLEIYNEKINDLLDTNAKDIKIREDYDQVVHVQVKEEVIRKSNELFSIMKRGAKTRKIGCTDMNERSSRSHTIFKLVIQSQNKDSEGSYTESSLSLVDLAGSERVGQMNMKGERQAEGVSINKSLTTLGLVIRKLSENEPFINYRDSKLTRLLQHSLGGNSKTLIICTVTVATAEETKSTLEFAQRAKYVKNRPIINEKVTDKDQLKQYAHLCQDYKDQIEKLRIEKLEKDKTINALEDKISNIKLFTSDNVEQKVGTMPQRRHTLSYYTFITKSSVPGQDNEALNECDEDDSDHSPVKLDVQCASTSKEERQNVIFDTDTPAETCDISQTPKTHTTPLPVLRVKLDVQCASTSKDERQNVIFDTDTPAETCNISQTPKTHKTPSPVLRIQKGLLEESYNSLRSFTNHERQLMEQHDQIKELNELIDRLRTENIGLNQQINIDSQRNSRIIEKNREVFDRLIFLRSILEGRPVEEVRRMSLHTIEEEEEEEEKDVEMVMDPAFCIELLDRMSSIKKTNDELKEKCANFLSQNLFLHKQLTEKENIISTQSASSSKEIDKMEAKYTALATENEKLKTQLETGNIKVNELQTCISQHNDIKDAELEILTKKIKQLNDYKEEMHQQISELHRSKELLKDEPNQNTALQNDLDILRKEYDEVKQLAEYGAFKIGELEKENQELKTELLTTRAELKTQVTDVIKNKWPEGADKEITSLKQALVDLESQLNEFKSKHLEELLELREELILREELEAHNLQQPKENLIQDSQKKIDLTKQVAFLNDQLKEKLLELDSQHQRNDALNDQIKQYTEQIKHQGILEKENNKLKAELEDVVFQLSGEQKEVETISQQLDEKSLVISGLEKTIFHLNQEISMSKSYTEKVQELTSMNVKLQEDLSKKEEEIKTLEEKCTFLDAEYTKTARELGENIKQLREKDEHNRCSNEIQQKLEEEIENLVADNAEMKEKLQKNIDLENRLDKEIVELKNMCSSQEQQCDVLKKENSRLKLDLEHVLSQLCEKETYVLEMCRKQDDHASLISGLQGELSHMKEKINHSQAQSEQFQEISNINASLRADVCQREEEIQHLQENIRLLNEKDAQTRNLMQKYIQKLKAQDDELKKITVQSNLKTIDLMSLENENLELKSQIEKLSNEYNRLQDLGQKVQENSEVEENNLDLEKHLSEEVKTLKEKCSTQEHELKKALKQLNNTLQELDRQTESYNDLEAKCTIQGSEIENYNEQLINKMAELNDKRNLYDNVLATLADKNVEIESLKVENEDLKNKLIQLSQIPTEISDLQESLTKINNDNDKIKKEPKKQLDSNANLQNDLEQCYLKITNLKTQLNNKNMELDVRVNENAFLTKEILDLKSHIVALKLSQEQDIEILETENLFLKQQLNQSSKDNIDIALQLARINDEFNSNKPEEVKTIEMEKAKLEEKMKLALNDLLKIKRNLDKRNEEFSYLKGKYNALEVQLDSCQDSLKTKNQLLQRQKDTEQLMEISKSGKEALILQITELKSKVEYLSLQLEKMQEENKLKIDQLKLASEEIDMIRGTIKKVEFLEAELEQYKLNLQQPNVYEENITLLNNTVHKLTDKNLMLEKQLSNSTDRMISCKQKLTTEDQSVIDQKQLEEEELNSGDPSVIDQKQLKKELNTDQNVEFQACQELITVLESQVKQKEGEIEYLTEKLQVCETEIDNLQEKVNDLVEYKQRVQEKMADGTLKEVSSPRLSDEGRPLSPNELRRFKRQSIHDQRRGLMLESSNSLELADIDCPDCQDLRNKLKKILEKNKGLAAEIEDVKKNIEQLKWENRYMKDNNAEMALKIKKLQEKASSTLEKTTDCSECKELTLKLTKIEDQKKTHQIEIEELKKETISLDKENEEMLKIIREMEKSETELHNQLLSRQLPDSLSGNELCKLQAKYDEVITKKTELEKELEQNKKLVLKYKNNLSDMETTYLDSEYKHEKIEKELQRKLDDHESKLRSSLPVMEDKEVQATCELHEKYKKAKKLLQIRRQEGNYLRAQLNLPPDCAVLPEDIQRQPTNL